MKPWKLVIREEEDDHRWIPSASNGVLGELYAERGAPTNKNYPRSTSWYVVRTHMCSSGRHFYTSHLLTRMKKQLLLKLNRLKRPAKFHP